MTERERDAPDVATTGTPSRTSNPVVLRAIGDALRAEGRISFAKYMDLVLYLPEDGYYSAAGDLPGRDYRTSPAVHPAFGALAALQLEQMWQVLGQPGRFTVIEPGAGNGALCRAILHFLRQLDPGFAEALHYVIVEPRPASQQLQRAAITDASHGVSWVTGSALNMPLGSVVGCVLSNELIDALPFHRVVQHLGVLYESYVVERDGALQEELGEPSAPELGEYFTRLGLRPPEGCLVEVSLAAGRFIREAAAALTRGFVLTIDYGLPAEELYCPQRRYGSLRCYHRHQYNSEPFLGIGNQDITAYVDLASLIAIGREEGLRLTGVTSQRDFLQNLGWEAFVRQIEGAAQSDAQRFRNKFALQDLVSQAGLGGFTVLIQHKGISDPELDAFNSCNDRKRALLTGNRRLAVPLMEEVNPASGWRDNR